MMKHAGRRLLAAVAATLLVAVSLPWPTVTYAVTTFTVTTTTDAPKLGGSGANCQSTTTGNPCTLRAAVQTHNSIGGTNTINISTAGTYTLALTGNNDDTAATGDLDVTTGTLTI